MFSGIIQQLEKPLSYTKAQQSIRVVFPIPHDADITEGESINIDGVCSTVEKIADNTFSVYWMDETLKRTCLASLPKDHAFNLERSLTLNDLIGGHLVSGHTDVVATVTNIENVEDSRVIRFLLPKEFTKYLIYKGSVGINGVSLTVIDVSDTSFSVSLIPFTLQHTNLGDLKVGDSVNIEIDMIAKYIEKLAKSI